MKVGVHLPQWGPGARRDGVLAVARAAEESGLDSLWVADHVVIPIDGRGDYPYQSETPFGPGDGFLEAFTQLAVVAGATERIRLGSSVLVLPMRETLLTAKTVATLEALAPERLALAIGAGWWEEEFEALGAPFARRGKRLDEQLEALRMLWREGSGSFKGEHIEFANVACEPRPADGGPPLLIGGMGPPACKRAGRLGDGWHALGVHAETLEEGRAAMEQAAAEAGREPAALTVSTSTVLPEDDETALRRLQRLRGIGVHEVVLQIDTDPDAIRRGIERLTEKLLPALGEQG